MTTEGTTEAFNKLNNAAETRGNTPMLPPERVKSDPNGMAVDTPDIAIAASSSSSPVSCTSTTTLDVQTKIPQSCQEAAPPARQQQQQQQQHQANATGGRPWCHSYHYASKQQHTCGHLGAPFSHHPRGMVPASPGGPKTPPPIKSRRTTAASASRDGRNEIGGPPKLYRVTSLSSRNNKNNNRSRLSWSPFAIDRRRYSDQQLQQFEEQRRRRSSSSSGIMYHYGCLPTLPHPYQHLPIISPADPYLFSGYRCSPEVIGHPALRIYKVKLPVEHMDLLDQIVDGCEAHAQKRRNGWRTDLYSLTQQDIALMDVPNVMKIAMPIMEYLSQCICEVFHASSVRVDRNQPHVLKYNEDHTGVELHHDRCDVTANLMLSRSHTYVGGGTYFPDVNRVVRLKFGEFLLHPGQLVHSGHDISAGNRYLMVLFANLK